jgi:aldehyde dehydrogenase (NAD+)
MEKDLGRGEFFSWFGCLVVVMGDLEHNIEGVLKWMKDEPRDTPNTVSPASSKVVYEPLGTALIMSAWNFPVLTCIEPLAAAITAGNCAMIKCSEMSPHTAEVIKNIVEKYLDTSCFDVIEGGPEVASELTKQRFDAIVFTGSPAKGKLVATEAGKNLVPCILELGGKCPVVVDESCNLDWAAKKIVFGRYSNSG